MCVRVRVFVCRITPSHSKALRKRRTLLRNVISLIDEVNDVYHFSIDHIQSDCRLHTMAEKIFQRIFMVCIIIQAIKFDRILCNSSSPSAKPSRALQIIVPENHAFRLNTDALHAIFNDDNLKNRHLVVVSIAGPHCYGKSFLMNFFIPYLEAQVN